MKNLTFLEFQNKKYSESEYLDKMLILGDSLIFGTSFFINNASYKNTIASGTFSNIRSIELKRKISDYYEVYGEKLRDNNKILDDVRVYYFVNTFPKPQGWFKKRSDNKDSDRIIEYYKKNGLFDESLLSKKFIIYNQEAKSLVEIYLRLMKTFQKNNQELIKLVESKIKN